MIRKSLAVVLSTFAIGGAFALMVGQINSLGSNSDPIKNDVDQIVQSAPGAALDGIKETTDTISSNPTTNSIASQSDVYQGAATSATVLEKLERWFWLLVAIAKVIIKIAILIALVALATRTYYRSKRRYVTFEIRTHREAVISTEQISALISTLNQLIYVRARRLQRVFKGSPSLAFRVVSMPDRVKGTAEIANYVTLPEDLALAFDQSRSTSDAYQDLDFIKVKDSWPTAWAKEIVRNKKRRPIPFTVRTPGISQASESFDEGFNSPVMDKVVAHMASHKIPIEFQIVCTPSPEILNRLVRFLASRRMGPTSQSGVGVSRQDAESAANDSHLFVEMRVASGNYEVSRDTAGILQGAGGGDASLRERRPVIRKRIYQRRFVEGTNNPIPSWLYCVYATSEIASIWQLPSSQLRSITTKRTNKRRTAVPPEVEYVNLDRDRPNRAMFLSPERKPITLKVSDFKYGIAVVGQQGTGKTSLAARLFTSALNAETAMAGVVLDPKGDLAELTLEGLVPGRKIRYIDFAEALIGLDVWGMADKSERNWEEICEIIIAGLSDVVRTESGESQIYQSSKDFLRRAIIATLATTVPFGIKPTFHHLNKWISPDKKNVKWRDHLLNTVIGPRKSLSWLMDSYEEYHAQLEQSSAQVTVRAAAPMNKNAELLTPAIDKVLRHERSVNLEEVIKNREILIINGRNLPGATTVLRFVWQLIDQMLGRLESEHNRAKLRRQEHGTGEVPDLVRVLVAADELSKFATPTIADIIARRRSAGLNLIAAWQHDAQIESESTLSTLRNLLQNVFQFRTGAEDARERMNTFQMIYDDQQDSRMREVRTNRVSTADLVNLDPFHFYAFHLVDGRRIPVYWATTINPALLDSHAIEHIKQIKAEGGHLMPSIPVPDYGAESSIASQRMILDPPDFDNPEDFGAKATGDVDIDFETALKANDPAPESDPETPQPRPAQTQGKDADAEADRTGISTIEPSSESSTNQPPSASNGNGNNTGNGGPPSGQGTSALDPELPIDKSEILADLRSATNKIAGPGNEKNPNGWKAGETQEVGPLGQHVGGEISAWLETVDAFRVVRHDRPMEFLLPPADATPGSVAARNERAITLAADPKVVPVDFQSVLHLLYEFNALTQTQIVFATGLSKSTVTRRLNGLLATGIVKGFTLGKQKVWTLTDLGCRVGRQIGTRYGPLIPFEPGKGKDGKHEAKRKWGERNIEEPRQLIHDFHLASWTLQCVELLDGDLRYISNANHGLVQKVTGEFGARVEPPTRMVGRKKQPIDMYSLSEVLGPIAFTGIDLGADGRIRAVSPDASIRLHNLTNDPETHRRELWIEMDRQGHVSKLEDKLKGYDAFLATWGRTVPRFKKAGRGPVIIFVARTMDILRTELRVADRSLTAQAGPRRDGYEAWPPPPSRNRIFFALESDLHKGSTRVYRVPELTPRERLAQASDDQERSEARNCRPRVEEHLFPPRLMAGRRDGTNEPPKRRIS